MPKQPDLEHLSHAELTSLVRELLSRLEKLEAENTRLHQDNTRVRTENEGLKRERARQAAPFSRNQPKPNPGKPGRQPGLGTFKHRLPPTPAEITRTIGVPLATSTCPSCDTPLEACGVRLAWISELPEIKPEVIAYQLERATCPACGLIVQATHPAVSRDQVGATAHRLGPRALAVAHALQYELGVTARKVPRVLKLTVGLQLTQSAITQVALKHARENGLIGSRYQVLRDGVQHSSLVNTDDTSWRVAGQSAFLMAFKTSSSLVYQVRLQHRALEVLELIPANFAGVLACDRFSSYDAVSLAKLKQQKCIAHVLKNVKVLLETSRGRSRDFPVRMAVVVQNGVAVADEVHSG